MQPADAEPAHGTIASASMSWTAEYDPVDRITGFNATGNTAASATTPTVTAPPARERDAESKYHFTILM